MDYDVIVVGGGAAGLMAACTAAEQGRKVLLIEKMDQAGRKLRITGKGRCNLTNTNSLRDTLPHIGSSTAGTTKKPGQTGGVWLRNAYGRFFAPELMEWFERRGVELTVERGNRVYPASGKALDIFLALIGELEQNPNVTIRKPAPDTASAASWVTPSLIPYRRWWPSNVRRKSPKNSSASS